MLGRRDADKDKVACEHLKRKVGAAAAATPAAAMADTGSNTGPTLCSAAR